MIAKTRLFGILSFALIFGGCSSSSELSETRELKGYANAKLNIKPEFKVFHGTGDTTVIFIKFNTENLSFTKTEPNDYRAEVSISIDPSREGGGPEFVPEKKEIAVPPIPRSAEGSDILAKTSIYLPSGSMYSLLVELKDDANGKKITKLLKADKTNQENRQNFLAREYGAPSPLFMDRVAPNRRYEIELGDTTATLLYVNYYNPSFSLPPPPFAYFDPGEIGFSPDERFTLATKAGRAAFTTGAEGFYHFRRDTTTTEGFTLFISSSEFPEVKEVRNMLEPFRYLVSGKEYKSILDADDLKAEIEKYWINWAGDQNRARNSIKAYYTRVELANRFFSSHLEGWKSDRGLIYLVYGEPDKVYKTEGNETWIYGEENNPLSITFRFTRSTNPFTDNDFRLKREDFYKPSWYRSIEAWRNGRTF